MEKWKNAIISKPIKRKKRAYFVFTEAEKKDLYEKE